MHIYRSGNRHSSESTVAYRALREERDPRNLSICSGMVQLQSFALAPSHLLVSHKIRLGTPKCCSMNTTCVSNMKALLLAASTGLRQSEIVRSQVVGYRF